jgi:hypothetical protein
VELLKSAFAHGFFSALTFSNGGSAATALRPFPALLFVLELLKTPTA